MGHPRKVNITHSPLMWFTMITPLSYKKFRDPKDWSQFLGNTIQKVHDENGDLIGLETVKWPLIPMTIFMVLGGVINLYFVWYVFVLNETNMEIAIEKSKTLDFGTVDFLSLQIWQFMTLFVYVLAPLLLPKQLKAIMKFVELTKFLGKKHTSNGLVSYDEVDRIGKKIQWRFNLKRILSILLYTITAMFFMVMFHQSIKALDIYDQTHFYTYLGLGFATVPFGSLIYYSLSVAFIESLTTVIALFAASAIKTWKEKFLRDYQKRDKEFGKFCSLSCI